MSTLSFEITVTAGQFDEWDNRANKPYRQANVIPLVDGKPLCNRYVFDAAVLLGHGDQAGETDLFTCTCGHAGCADIHEEVKLRVTKGEMHWIFPENPFRSEFDPDRFPADKPLTVKFKLSQYRKALSDLEARLINLEGKGDHPLIFCPGSSPEDTSVKSVLKATREWIRETQATEKQLCDLMGDYRSAQLKLTLAGSDFYGTIYLCSLMWNLGWAAHPDSEKDHPDYFANVLMPRWQQGGLDAIKQTLFALPWSEIGGRIYINPPRSPEKYEQFVRSWPNNIIVEFYEPVP